MLDIADMPTEPLLLEPTDAGHRLGLSASRVRALADEGRLPIAAKTSRGLRLFRPADVERLRKEREEAKAS